MQKDNQIKCPNCGTEINVSDILYKQVEEKIARDFEAKSAKKEKDLQKKLKELQQEKEQLSKEKEGFQEQIEIAVKTKLSSEKVKLEKAIRGEIKEETSEQIISLQKELEQKSGEVKELNKTKAEIEKLKREKDELRDAVISEKEKEFSEKLSEEKIKIRNQVEETVRLKNTEIEKQVEEQKRIIEELNKKAEQGSIQMQEKLKELQKEKEQLAKEKEETQERIDTAVRTKLNSEREKYEKLIKDKIQNETSDQILSLQKELEQKSGEVKELNKTKAEIEKLKREKDELRDAVISEKEKEFSEKLSEEKIKIKNQVEEASIMKNRELEKQLEDQKKLIEEMKRKAEQGSMQMQGEVQELVLEDILTSMFPFDKISEVAKGVKGADVVHTVRNKTGQDCGIILYESKRTKAFSNEWIGKLKTDAVAIKADMCIIVTETLPEGIEKIGQKDGVWICSFKDFKGLVLVIRESIININNAYASQTNKGEKMQMLYDYLTSNEFALQAGAIVEGFNELLFSAMQHPKNFYQ